MTTNLRLALRSLAKSPSFSVVAILTLALCIGANSAIFSIVNAILLKPYPWPGSERLVYVQTNYPKVGGRASGLAIPDYLDHRAGVPSFEESALITGFNANLSLDGHPERLYGLSVTPSLFALLQTPAALGRTFTEADAEPGAPNAVVLTDGFWRNRLGADPAILGRTLRLNGAAYTVVGVMPEGFYFPSLRAQFFVPFAITSELRTETERTRQWCTMLARLKPGVTPAQVQPELDAVHRATRERVPQLRDQYAVTGYGSIAVGFLAENVGNVKSMLWLLQAGVAAALLIGCANVANLLLTRASARQREFAIRSALGAGRAHLIRQLLLENLVLFLLGGGLGLLVATGSLRAVETLGVGNLPRGFGIALDARVFAFTLLSALATGLLFGALPAFSSTRVAASEALKSAGARTTADRRQLGLRSFLAVAQIALSLMLLATAGLLVRSFLRVQDESPGFDRAHALTAALSLPAAKYPTAEKRAAFVGQLTARLQAIPGVTAAGVTSALPFAGGNPQGAYVIEGFDPGPNQPNPNGMIRQVSPGYFAALDIPLLRGRLLQPSDALGRENVVVVDRFLAERYWPGADPIGKRLSRGDSATQGRGTWTIVGVVGTIKHWDLAQDVKKETIYFPYAQTPNNAFALLVRTSAPPAGYINAVRDAVLAVDPEQPVFDIKTMEARLEESLQPRRAPMLLLVVFAGVALALAVLGIYGVLAFSVGQRTSEFGVRMALGADRGAILRLVLRQGIGIVAAGLALGLLGYAALSSLVASQLYRVTSTDPLTLLAAPAVLAAIALAACLIPARRATRVDPMTALRTE
ncbi:MAG: ABC transporter permease [Opitutus sp.]|nr:ABC transporter permease [Opitutus sp.]